MRFLRRFLFRLGRHIPMYDIHLGIELCWAGLFLHQRIAKGFFGTIWFDTRDELIIDGSFYIYILLVPDHR